MKYIGYKRKTTLSLIIIQLVPVFLADSLKMKNSENGFVIHIAWLLTICFFNNLNLVPTDLVTCNTTLVTVVAISSDT